MRFKDAVLVSILAKMRTKGGCGLTAAEWRALEETEVRATATRTCAGASSDEALVLQAGGGVSPFTAQLDAAGCSVELTGYEVALTQSGRTYTTVFPWPSSASGRWALWG